jgi:hypothetical protein
MCTDISKCFVQLHAPLDTDMSVLFPEYHKQLRTIPAIILSQLMEQVDCVFAAISEATTDSISRVHISGIPRGHGTYSIIH